MPYETYIGPAGATNTYSLYSTSVGSKSGTVNGFWYLAEPLGVAVIALAAGGLVLAARNTASARWLGTGMLMAFGIQTLLLFSPDQFAHPIDVRVGIVGIAGAALLLTAAILALGEGARAARGATR